MDFLQTSKGMLKTPEFDATNDPIVTISKGMKKNLQNWMHHMTLLLLNRKVCKKTPKFDAKCDTVVTESKCMQKTTDSDSQNMTL